MMVKLTPLFMENPVPGRAGSEQAASHSSLLENLFPFPRHPPYTKFSHFLVSVLKKYDGFNASHGPTSTGSRQTGFVGSFPDCKCFSDLNGFFFSRCREQRSSHSDRLLKLLLFPPQPKSKKNARIILSYRLFYRVCHGFRVMNRDDYFRVSFDHF